MKNILIASLLILSSCTLPWSKDAIPSEHNFQNDYSRHVKAIFDTVDKNLELAEIIAKYMSPSGFDDSTIRISGIIPQIGSGELSVHANAVRETHLMSNLGAELDIRGFIASLDEKIQMNIKGGFINSLDSYYFHLDQAELSGSGSQYTNLHSGWNEFTQKFTPFFGKWIQVSLIDIANIGNKNSKISVTPLKLISSLEFDVLSGGKKIRKILSAHPMLRSLESLGKNNDLYSYRVELDHTGTLAFVDNFMLEYSGTGMNQEDREKLLDGLNKITLSGILSIHADQSEYMSFSGILTSTGEKSPLELDIAFLPSEMHMILGSEGKEVIALKGKTEGNSSEYSVSASGKTLATATMIQNKGTLELFDLFITPPSENGAHVQYSYKNKKDILFKIEQITEENKANVFTPLYFVGTMENMRLSMLSGSMTSEDGESVKLNYTLDNDGIFRAELQSKEIPGEVKIDGHFKDDDILVNLSSMGMNATLTYKKNSNNVFEGSIVLPMANMKWGGKTTKEFYDSFFINASSPVISASLNMKTVDGWLVGPLNISSPSESEDIPSIDIRAKRHDKDFSLQTDIGMGSGTTEKAHFELDSHIDVRWDKDAKVKIPTELIPFSDVYFVFSGSESSSSDDDGTASIPNDFSR